MPWPEALSPIGAIALEPPPLWASAACIIRDGLSTAVDALHPHEVELCDGAHTLRLWWERVQVATPSKKDDSLHSDLRPRECRACRHAE